MSDEKPADVPEKSLEYWLTRAADPYLAESNRPSFIKGFCEQVNEELEGHQIACRLLAHKIQSPYEKEALHSLSILDACVRNCGQRFHNEIAKFRFLNELIKILSPKYLGNQTGEKVKQRTVELLYAWKQGLRHLPKIKQAYDMLKEQGIITQDPTYMDEIYEAPPPPPKHKLASFEDEEKSRLLSQLLRSKNAEDLQAANRLIKSMVRAEDQKVEKMTKRSTDLQAATNNAKLLAEMVTQYDRSSSSNQDRELMKELADSLQKTRPSLYRYAGEAAEGDEEVLADVLSCNDEVSRAMEDYKTKVESHLVNNLRSNNQPSSSGVSSSLLNFDIPVNSPGSFALGADLRSRTSSDLSLCADDVLMLGSGGTPLISRRNTTAATPSNMSAVAELSDIFGQPAAADIGSAACSRALAPGQQNAFNASKPAASIQPTAQPAAPSGNKGLMDLDQLSESLIQTHLPSGMTSTMQLQQNKKATLRDLLRQQTVSTPTISSANQVDSLALNQLVTTSAPGSASESGTVTPAGLKPIPLTPHPTPIITSSATSPNSSSPSVDLLGLSAAVAAIADVAADEQAPKAELESLDDIDVPLHAIQPGSRQPVNVMDRDQLKVVLHYTANRPRPDVLTAVVSVTSCRSQALENMRFEARVRDDKAVLVKLLEPTATSLPAYNPIFPQTAITQVLLLTAIAEEESTRRISLEYTLNYEAADQRYSITGCVPVDYWKEECRG